MAAGCRVVTLQTDRQFRTKLTTGGAVVNTGNRKYSRKLFTPRALQSLHNGRGRQRDMRGGVSVVESDHEALNSE